MVESLRERLGDVLDFTVPAGGMAVWCRTDPGIDVDRWAAEARTKGVIFQPGSDFAFEVRPIPALRAGFARLPESELREAVRRLAAAVPASRIATMGSARTASTSIGRKPRMRAEARRVESVKGLARQH